VVIFAGANGYLDDLPVRGVGPFERALLSNLRSKHADILTDIAKEKSLSDSIKERIVAALDGFKKTYTA
jgi:F-type H+/Na+-transporting ATPase subunit alpha